MSKKPQLTTARLHMYLADAKILNYYRRNPIIACEDLLGIYLSDAQAYALAGMWTADVSAFAASRNWGKSFIIAIICLLRAILYPDQNIYIVSSVGSQAKETHSKIEELCLRTGHTAASTPDLKDIAMGEIETSAKNPSGFKHDPSSYEVRFHNGSAIYTLNAKPDNIRGKRSNLTVFDEAAFCAEDLIVAVEPFSTQNSDARYGQNTAITKDTLPRQPYNQILFCSSQDTVDALFYKRYKECAKKMLAGDTSRFCIDMTCETAMTMYMKGKEIPSLLSRSTVEAALKSNASKARREYYNKADLSGGDNQIIKWGTMRHNETQIIPYEECRGNKIILGFDPARTMDNSIVTAMEIIDDPDMGICGNIVGCTNLVDIASRKKYKLDSNRQLEEIRNILLAYNGDNLDYEYIDSLQIDSGSGGGGLKKLPA